VRVAGQGAGRVPAPDPAIDLVTRICCGTPDEMLRPGDADLLAAHWPRIQAMAVRHRVAPLLAYRLQDRLGELPAPLAAQLANAGVAAAGRALEFASSAQRVLAILAGAGIPALLFKGLALAVRAFGSPAARRSADIDVLVRDADFYRACDALVAAGLAYRVHGRDRRRDGVVRGQIGLRIGATKVDLHCSFTAPWFGIHFPAEAVLERASDMVVAGVSLRTPCLEDSYISAAVALAKDSWSRLDMIAALVHLDRKLDDGRRDAIASRCEAAGFGQALAMCGAITARVAGSALPAAERAGAVRGAARRYLLDRAQRALQLGEPPVNFHLARLAMVSGPAAAGGVARRAAWELRLRLTPPDWRD
jgi:hypothetical protein